MEQPMLNEINKFEIEEVEKQNNNNKNYKIPCRTISLKMCIITCFFIIAIINLLSDAVTQFLSNDKIIAIVEKIFIKENNTI